MYVCKRLAAAKQPLLFAPAPLRQLPKAIKCRRGTPLSVAFCPGRPGSQKHPGGTEFAAGGPCDEEILRSDRRPGGPHLYWDHRADEGGYHLRPIQRGQAGDLCGTVRRECNPIAKDFKKQEQMTIQKKRKDWNVMSQISEDMYVYCNSKEGCLRYVLLYVHHFRLYTPHKILEATMMNQTYHSYGEITAIPDRLRWCRHHLGLMQREVAAIAGLNRSVYNNIECGTTQHIPLEAARRLAEYYGVSADDFIDEYSRFHLDGQVQRISAYRSRLKMKKKPFCKYTGIPLTSLREWEKGNKTVSYKCWEKYFKGRA